MAVHLRVAEDGPDGDLLAHKQVESGAQTKATDT